MDLRACFACMDNGHAEARRKETQFSRKYTVDPIHAYTNSLVQGVLENEYFGGKICVPYRSVSPFEHSAREECRPSFQGQYVLWEISVKVGTIAPETETAALHAASIRRIGGRRLEIGQKHI